MHGLIDGSLTKHLTGLTTQVSMALRRSSLPPRGDWHPHRDLLTSASERLEHITKRPECRGVIDRGMFLLRHALVVPTDC